MTAAHMLVAAALAGPAADAAGAAAVAKWHALLPGVRTLDIKLDIETADHAVRSEPFRYSARLWFVRTPAGPLADFVATDAAGREVNNDLLHGDGAYRLDPAEKSANRFRVTDGDHAGFLARNFHPLALLTDAARAGAYHVRVAEADEHYIYLHVVATPAARRDGVYSAVATVAVFKQAAGGFPAGAPALIRHTEGLGQLVTTYRLRSWDANPPAGLTAADFVPPEKRDGWRVADFSKLWPQPRN